MGNVEPGKSQNALNVNLKGKEIKEGESERMRLVPKALSLHVLSSMLGPQSCRLSHFLGQTFLGPTLYHRELAHSFLTSPQ